MQPPMSKEKREQFQNRGESSSSSSSGSARGTIGQGSKEDAVKALQYILKEIDLGKGPQLQIRPEGGKSFSPFEQFYKGNPGFQPNPNDLPMFNKHNLFMPAEPPPPQAPPPGPQAMAGPPHIMQALGAPAPDTDPLAQLFGALGARRA